MCTEELEDLRRRRLIAEEGDLAVQTVNDRYRLRRFLRRFHRRFHPRFHLRCVRSLHGSCLRMHREAMGLAPVHPEAPVGGYAPAYPVR